MTKISEKILTYFTLASCAVVGASALKMFTATETNVSINTSYLNVFSGFELSSPEIHAPKTVVNQFHEISFPVMRMEYVEAPVQSITKIAKTEVPRKFKTYKEGLLPFYEPVVLSPVHFEGSLPTNLVALYEPVKEFEEIKEMLAKAAPVVEDRISTVAAAPATNSEPVFLDYTENEKALIEAPTSAPVVAVAEVENSLEEVEVEDLVAFDYTKANEDIKAEKIPTVSHVNVPVTKSTPSVAPASVVKPNTPAPAPAQEQSELNSIQAPEKEEKSTPKASKFKTSLVIQAVGTDFKKNEPLKGYELRFQDDRAEILDDHNTGAVLFEENLAEEKMTRSAVLLKRGYAPTNTELILENAQTDISLPLIEEQKFNALMEGAPRGPTGAILVELDDNTEYAKIDGSASKVITLDGELKETESNDFRYQLFLGVKAGNVMVSYKDHKGVLISKVVHVHENEVTYDANYYEDVTNQKFALFEEDMLSKEEAPLIITTDAVKAFASNEESKKINDHTYKVPITKILLGDRKHIVLTHQDEPIYVRTRDAVNISVPSESFMRFILSKIEGKQLTNRCLVQVNLSRQVTKVDVASESTAESLVTYTQMLDKDGKFYDSAGEKTEKVIIVGDNQGAVELSKNGKINVKITYSDGSVQFLNSYCSPNTYLVEQL
jgi:hypothetical protein